MELIRTFVPESNTFPTCFTVDQLCICGFRESEHSHEGAFCPTPYERELFSDYRTFQVSITAQIIDRFLAAMRGDA
jgi:hypothetical protein